MTGFRFFEFRVYQESKILYRKVVFITKSLPVDQNYFKDQLRRAALSIVLNIAEGAGKNSDKDFARYLGNALGSANELAAGFDVLFDEKLINLSQKNEIMSLILNVKNQLGSFSKKLKADS